LGRKKEKRGGWDKEGEKCKLAETISESRIPIGFRVLHFKPEGKKVYSIAFVENSFVFLAKK